MILRKLRLQRGWSQEQLADMAGVTVRTIQRLERGHKPGLETAKSLAAVFEVEFSIFLSEERPMTSDQSVDKPANQANSKADLEEDLAVEYIKGVKEFFSHLLMYVIFCAVFLFLDDEYSSTLLWGFFGWGVGVLFHGLSAFEVIRFGTADWERKLVEWRLGRKW
ncbi:helix-turn-helix domain-containing protein [Simiduia sp. 21SJ11W-1]|uniref:helix-turn-helix domain-containing protein n=1 Tax=Simiduia sp. 21SJ11W-1 TaxID=2909669 RepID=UPI00209F4ABC|nr:helix-turn-helix domain-containing protein [Simiduia sp. 21SJ11W-1]UTA48533.1 helix-turn-helix domain-containing protein [Simiduia sp. 21SJ11W-1]